MHLCRPTKGRYWRVFKAVPLFLPLFFFFFFIPFRFLRAKILVCLFYALDWPKSCTHDLAFSWITFIHTYDAELNPVPRSKTGLVSPRLFCTLAFIVRSNARIIFTDIKFTLERRNPGKHPGRSPPPVSFNSSHMKRISLADFYVQWSANRLWHRS